MELEALLERLEGVVRHPSGISARCPSHDDRVASLSVGQGEAGLLVHCHAGCRPEDVMAALGLTVGDLAGKPRLVATYPYQSDDGVTLYTVQRWAPKAFRVDPGLPEAAFRVPYNLPWIAYARDNDLTVYVVEGERDVETLRRHNLVGTTNVGGAGVGKWLDHYSRWLEGCDVVVIADNDEPGIIHARNVFGLVVAKARSASLCRPLYGKDVTELLEAGYPITHVEPVPLDAPLVSILAASVRTTAIRWAWQGFMPSGSVTIVEGDPGDGKSTLTCDLVARWTNGDLMPDGVAHDGPFDVLMVSAEDDPATTIVPRLRVAGANLHRVTLITGGTDEARGFSLITGDLVALEKMIVSSGAKILVLDPLMAFMPDKINGLVDAEVRRTLWPLKRLAEKYGLAILVVRHLVKGGTRALYAGSGSIGIVGMARAAYLIRPDPMNKANRVMAATKGNLAKRPPSLVYTLEDVDGIARVVWLGESNWDADALYEGNTDGLRAREQAALWIEETLDNTFMSWKELTQKGRAEGYSEGTLRRARGDVARSVVNPALGGELIAGTYWYRVGQWPFDGGSGDVGLPRGAFAQPPGPQELSKREDESPSVVEGVCEVCGAPDAIRIETEEVDTWRCVNHPPW